MRGLLWAMRVLISRRPPPIRPWYNPHFGLTHDVARCAVQLATVTGDGLPAVRTVVFRGWMQNPIRDDEEGAGKPDDPIDVDVHLKFITDLRSSKMAESKVAEACWYFTETREQFRLRGELIMVTHESTDARLIRQRTGLWKSISDAARAQFSWPTPGSDRPPEADDEKDFRCPADINAVSDNFVLMLLRPNYIDHLRLKGFPQKRVLWRRGDQKSWDAQPVNP